MKDYTDEFSFVLKPSEFGVGVYTTHGIKKGTHLRLFGDQDVKTSIERDKGTIPNAFLEYCVDRGEYFSAPADFGHMFLGWYMNHSNEQTYIQMMDMSGTPNVISRQGNKYLLIIMISTNLRRVRKVFTKANLNFLYTNY